MARETIQMIFIVAILCEALVEYGKTIAGAIGEKEYKTFITQLVTVALGIFLAYAFNLQLFNHAIHELYSTAPINSNLDIVITGILFSRGSNYFSDIVGKLTQGRIGIEDLYIDDIPTGQEATEAENERIDRAELEGEFTESTEASEDEIRG